MKNNDNSSAFGSGELTTEKIYHVTSIVEDESRLVCFYLDQVCI